MSYDILTCFSSIINLKYNRLYIYRFTRVSIKNKLNENKKLHLFIIMFDAQFLVRNKNCMIWTYNCKNVM